MVDDPRAADADAAEQDAPVAAEPPARDRVDTVGDRPEADVLEQAAVVQAEQFADPPDRRAEVPEADAWEQSIGEPVDDDDRP